MNSRLPAYLNKKSGSVDAAREALSAEGFELQEVEPEDLVDHFRDAVTRGIPRMVFAGGAGSIAAAAAARREGQTAEELHASDYEIYAYLQTGQDDAARRIVDSFAGNHITLRSEGFV